MIERWFLLPDMYRVFEDAETLKRFAAAFMRRYYPEWTPIKIKQYRVLAKKEGDKNEHVQ
ncbi:hypothetical protein AB432_018495 [Brevibacillus brevis]|uniref:Uncharacterized protein n=1 Tax=Brevibacillus brevis TaxID=1393 RepID=A0A2Z4MKC0_BREBE|nr:hypothetical protein AB432_018495 [Brevibacillus brevis]